MRSVKPHHSWKLDDERRKRSNISSARASPINNYSHNNSSGNYTDEKTHSGIETIPKKNARCTYLSVKDNSDKQYDREVKRELH